MSDTTALPDDLTNKIAAYGLAHREGAAAGPEYRALVSAISGELARQRDMTKEALEALARVEKERDEIGSELYASEKRVIEEGERRAAAESESARLREALIAAEEWMADDGCDCGVMDPPCALCVVRATLSSSPATPENSATKEE